MRISGSNQKSKVFGILFAVLVLSILVSSSIGSSINLFISPDQDKTSSHTVPNSTLIPSTLGSNTPETDVKLGSEEEKPVEELSSGNVPRSFPKNHPMNDYSDVLVIVNENSTISQQIGNYFQAQRNIPSKNMCVINTSTSEWIYNYTFFDMQAQIEEYIKDNNLTNKINYLVTTKGVPLRIYQSDWRRRASVDSELCLILGIHSIYIDDPVNRQITNVYYNENQEFSRYEERIYLVTRLTGFNFTQVKQLIDNAALSANQGDGGGSFLFNRDPAKGSTGQWGPGNTRMWTADGDLDDKGFTSVLDWNGGFRVNRNNLAGYSSWGGYDSRYLTTPVYNTGFETDSSPNDGVPDYWFHDISNSSDHIENSSAFKLSGQWSVNITRDAVNTSSYTAISQNITINPNYRYYTRGWVRRDGITSHGGAHIQIKAYNSINELVWTRNGTPIYGTNSNWGALNKIYYDPITGVTKLKISAVLSKSSGTAFFDNIGLYEIKPRHSYVPGAIAEVYGRYTARTFNYDDTYSRFITELNVGELIMDGVTGIQGYVDHIGDPYIDTNARVTILFDRYTDGYNLAESYYMASPYMSWVGVVIGDPKAAPYYYLLPEVNLKAENITFSKENPNQGDMITVKTRIENHGGADVQNVDIKFSIGKDYESSKQLNITRINFIGKQASVEIQYSFDTTNYNGNHTIWVSADPYKSIREQNESNNIQSKEIKINSYPFGVDLKLSETSITRTKFIDVFLNITDNETIEEMLNCTLYYNHSASSSWTQLDWLGYYTDHWQTRFTTGTKTPIGAYDLKIVIKDENNASITFLKYTAFVVLNNAPVLGNFEVVNSVIHRTKNVTIFFTASDIEDEITKGMLSVYLGSSGGIWFTPNYALLFDETNSRWQITINTNKSSKTTTYDIKLELTDNDDSITILEHSGAFMVINNEPVIDRVTVSPISIYRGEFATVSIFGSDIENSNDEISVELDYKLNFETEPWMPIINTFSKSFGWEAIFSTNRSSYTGNYIFRARLIDMDLAETEYLLAEETLLVQNTPPVAKHNFMDLTQVFEANEDQRILFDADNSSDEEDYKCSAFLWDFDDGSTSEMVRIHHTYYTPGDYNISLTVYDKNHVSDQTDFKIRIRNVPPVAEAKIETSSANILPYQIIWFDATGSYDTESDKANLTYLWDFDDGNQSTDPKTNHSFSKSGTYFIKLTVTDNNDITDVKNIDITVEPAPLDPKKSVDKKESEDFLEVLTSPLLLIPIILVIIVIIILIAAAMIMRKRRKQEEEEEKQRSILTVEAEVADAPDFKAGKPTAGTTVKPGVKPAVTTLDATMELVPRRKVPRGISAADKGQAFESPKREALPPPTETGAGDGEPEVEVEYVPKVTLPEVDVIEPVASDEVQEVDEVPEVTTELPPDLDIEVELPPDAEDLDFDTAATVAASESVETEPEPVAPAVEKPKFGGRSSELSEADDDDLDDFEPPEIDLSGIVPSGSRPVAQPHRQEIIEAQKRGDGLSFDFKKPKKGK